MSSEASAAPLRIVGRIHPPAASSSLQEPDDLTAAEIKMYSSCGLNTASDASVPLPILIEHGGGAVGSVLSSWQASDGSLKMAASIKDPEAKRMVQNGQMRGLSIGSSLHHKGSSADAKLLQTLDEVSVCEKPRRPGCWIESIALGNGAHQSVCTPMYASQKKYPKGDYVSREAYEAMQKMLNDAQQQNALFKSRAERTDAVNANYITQNHEKIVEGLNILQEDLKDSSNAIHVAPMCAWADNLAKTPASQLDSEMSIAVTMCAASDRIKRGREAEESLKEKDEALSALYKERDDKNEQIQKLQRSLNDMEELAKDRQKKAEELGLIMQRKLNYSAMHNFANPDSRFKEPASEAAKRAADSLQSKSSNGKAPMPTETPTSCAAEVHNVGGGIGGIGGIGGGIGGLNTTVAVASAGAVASSGDSHAMFKTNASMLANMIETRGRGGSRFTPSDTSHHLLGRAPPSGAPGSSTASIAEIADAIKMY